MNKKYDNIVIGAGIGGLVCACYLAREGRKVLLLEQHSIPGGYCTSFTRGDYRFDAAVHSLRGVKDDNQVGILLNDLNIKDKLELDRINPSDQIIFGNKTINISNKVEQTIEGFKTQFPNIVKEIEDFFNFMIFKNNFVKLYRLAYGKSFKNLLDNFFSDEEIKGIFNVLLGNLGLNGATVSAITALVFFRELFTDAGYYPRNGIQSFPDVLTQRFIELGGDIQFSQEITGILLKKSRIQGVMTQRGDYFEAPIVVSNIDATETFTKIIPNDRIKKYYLNKIEKLQLSPSAFIVYLGIKKVNKFSPTCCTLWHFPEKNSVNCYDEAFKGRMSLFGKYFICGFASYECKEPNVYSNVSLSLTSIVPWRNNDFWEKNRIELSDRIVNEFCKTFEVRNEDIEVKEIATPVTFVKYTKNRGGAAYGWASNVCQINRNVMPQETKVEGLYLCGHWATRGWGQGGISMVANSGRTTAELITKRYRGRE